MRGAPASLEALIDRAAESGEAPLALAQTAIALVAADHPPARVAAALAHLSDLAAALQQRLSTGTPLPGALQATLAGAFGYDGDRDTYDDLANADLVEVIARRRGLPVALGILYIHAARAAGAEAHGLNAPGHFLIDIAQHGATATLDPFNGGRMVGPEDIAALVAQMTGRPAQPAPLALPAMSDKAVLVRLLSNVRARARTPRTRAGLRAALTRLLRLEPEAAELWYELGVCEAGLEAPRAAVAALTRALALAPEARFAAEAAALRDRLRRRLN